MGRLRQFEDLAIKYLNGRFRTHWIKKDLEALTSILINVDAAVRMEVIHQTRIERIRLTLKDLGDELRDLEKYKESHP